MATPESAAPASTDSATSSNSESFESRVNSVLSNATRDDAGKLVFPEDVPEEVKYAASLERRRRDTQAAYTKAQQSALALKAENEELLKLANEVKADLTPQQEAELEEIKFSDPDKWRRMLNTYEAEARNKQGSVIKEKLKEVSTKEAQALEIQRRSEVLKDYQSKHPNFVINDEILKNDVPPRLTGKLERGEITFEDFLDEVNAYLTKGKALQGTESPPNQPNLSKAGGGDVPAAYAVGKEFEAAYGNFPL